MNYHPENSDLSEIPVELDVANKHGLKLTKRQRLYLGVLANAHEPLTVMAVSELAGESVKMKEQWKFGVMHDLLSAWVVKLVETEGYYSPLREYQITSYGLDVADEYGLRGLNAES